MKKNMSREQLDRDERLALCDIIFVVEELIARSHFFNPEEGLMSIRIEDYELVRDRLEILKRLNSYYCKLKRR